MNRARLRVQPAKQGSPDEGEADVVILVGDEPDHQRPSWGITYRICLPVIGSNSPNIPPLSSLQ